MAGEFNLRGLTWDHPRAVEGLEACAPEIQQLFATNINWSSRSLLAFGDQHISEFAADYDLLIIDHPHIPDAVMAEAVLPIDQIIPPEKLAQLERESVGQSHNSYRYHGRVWAFAVDTAAQVSVYRVGTDGVPPFWSDVLADSRKGRVLWPFKPVDAFSTFATLMAQLGKPLLEPGEFLNREAALRALEMMIELAAHVPEVCAHSNPIDVAELLSSSTDYDYAPALYGYTNYSRAGFRKHRLHYDDVVSFDGRATGSQLGGAGVAVSASTKHPELAASIAAHLSLAGAQAGAYTRGGGQPGNLRAWLKPELNELTGHFFRNTLRTLERAWVRPRVFGYPDYQFAVSQIIHRALLAKSVTSVTISEIDAQVAVHLRESLG